MYRAVFCDKSCMHSANATFLQQRRVLQLPQVCDMPAVSNSRNLRVPRSPHRVRHICAAADATPPESFRLQSFLDRLAQSSAGYKLRLRSSCPARVAKPADLLDTVSSGTLCCAQRSVSVHSRRTTWCKVGGVFLVGITLACACSSSRCAKGQLRSTWFGRCTVWHHLSCSTTVAAT